RHLEKLRRGPEAERVHFVSICSPNYLHDAHIRLALRVGADAICEKPLVINPWNLDALKELEEETGRRVYTVLQLRLHPDLIALRERLLEQTNAQRDQVGVQPQLQHRVHAAARFLFELLERVEIPGVDDQRLLTDRIRADAERQPDVRIVQVIGRTDADEVHAFGLRAPAQLLEMAV